MIELPEGLAPELVPLSWLVGVWEGTGVVEYPVGDDDEVRNYEFGQRVSFSHDGLPYLNYSSTTWLLDDDRTPLAAEMGYWRIDRRTEPGDRGPAMLLGDGPTPFSTVESVEALRNTTDGFDVEAAIIHPTGVNELYVGRVLKGRIDLSTDAVLRSPNAKDYSAATRLYGLVEGKLFWAWDIAALGRELTSHASGQLAKVD
ncbi:FABP family protein [Curtobacterium flaccumfaciens]|uniref:FABP family protein n=1 Tax=Curtobacterium flaccumfaciens TaxID=2035 RepID=UPI000FFE508D|nr:FABP family protein [Curtobacterium flaccumfaciens]MCS0647448.1 FABP family protein [Curtobacterium flaccumfaciens pv. flaccumfaciens]MCS6525043.1 FABP family protein [Curtobacterium flaccumfaciens pv. flaccumfaciens]MCS6530189.1 FABP family protein [Curtobacterium flaccumfaciens pv. flaccumfaciens]NUU10135.1 FABP family protein [Curtobacterium flaccumfaciens]RXF85077.1 FABP family protein [Curtobacterium flaccumfaciens pv. flaccumfaciens]